MTVNGEAVRFHLDPATPLLWALRDAANLTGAKYGCDSRDCGACTVIVDERAVLSCAVTIGQLEGADIVTIEGLSSGLGGGTGQPVRLLRPGYDPGDRRLVEGQSPSERGGNRRSAQHLPLRRRPADPQGDCAGIDGDGGGAAASPGRRQC